MIVIGIQYSEKCNIEELITYLQVLGGIMVTMSIIWSPMACVSSVFYKNSTKNFITAGMDANKVFGLLTYFSISTFIFGLLEFVQFGILIKASVIVFGSYNEWKNEENTSSNMYC